MNRNLESARTLVFGNRLTGDALLTLPALTALTGPVDICAPAGAAPVYRAANPDGQFFVLPEPGQLLQQWRLIRLLRRERYTAAVIFPGSFHTALLAMLAGIPVRAGMSSDSRSLLLRRSWKPHPGYPLHQSACAALTAQLVNAVPKELIPFLSPDTQAAEQAEALLERLGLQPGNYIVCAPGASHPAKIWPGFASWLNGRRLQMPVLLTGTAGEIPQCTELAAAPDCHAIAGKTDLAVLGELLRRACCAVTNNSGTAHLAAAVGCKLYMISGPSELNLTRPAGAQHRIIFSDLPCTPCSRKKQHRCRDRLCLKIIKPEHLEQAMELDTHLKITPDGKGTPTAWKPVAHPAVTGKRVLIIGHSRLGDALMTAPLINRLHKLKPKLLAATACGAGLQAYRHLPEIQQAFKFGGKQSVKAVRELRFDTVFVLKDDFRSARTARRMRIPVRIGFRAEGGGRYLTRRIRRPGCHGALRHLFLLPHPAAGVLPPVFNIHETELFRARTLTGKYPPQVLLCPGTTRPEKEWPLTHWLELIRLLQQRGIRCGLAGYGPEEQQFNRALAEKSGAIDYTGLTTVGSLAALMTLCPTVVSCDNGPMHLAALLPNTTLIALFGQTDPELSGPRSRRQTVIRSAAACSPCRNRRCGRAPLCMQQIPPDRVAAAVFDSI